MRRTNLSCAQYIQYVQRFPQGENRGELLIFAESCLPNQVCETHHKDFLQSKTEPNFEAVQRVPIPLPSQVYFESWIPRTNSFDPFLSTPHPFFVDWTDILSPRPNSLNRISHKNHGPQIAAKNTVDTYTLQYFRYLQIFFSPTEIIEKYPQ